MKKKCCLKKSTLVALFLCLSFFGIKRTNASGKRERPKHDDLETRLCAQHLTEGTDKLVSWWSEIPPTGQEREEDCQRLHDAIMRCTKKFTSPSDYRRHFNQYHIDVKIKHFSRIRVGTFLLKFNKSSKQDSWEAFEKEARRANRKKLDDYIDNKYYSDKKS